MPARCGCAGSSGIRRSGRAAAQPLFQRRLYRREICRFQERAVPARAVGRHRDGDRRPVDRAPPARRAAAARPFATFRGRSCRASRNGRSRGAASSTCRSAAGKAYVGYDGSYRSRFSSNPSRSAYTDIEGYSLSNLRAGFRTDKWNLYGWVRNVFDKNYFELLSTQSGSTGLIVGQPGDPGRTARRSGSVSRVCPLPLAGEGWVRVFFLDEETSAGDGRQSRVAGRFATGGRLGDALRTGG